MKRMCVVGMMVVALSLLAASAAFSIDIHRINTGLNILDEDLVQPGYVSWMSANYKSNTIVLIDLYGNLVHEWECDNWKSTGDVARNAWPHYTADGTLVVSGSDTSGTMSSGVADTLTRVAGVYDAIVEFDWAGNVVADTGEAAYAVNFSSHHDYRKIWNNQLAMYTFLALGCQAYSADDAVALGVDPQYETNYTNGWSPDCITEMDTENNILWSWSFADHIVQNYDAAKVGAFTDGYGYSNPGAIYGEPADHPEKLHINVLTDNLSGPTKDWTHCNSLDYNVGLDQIVINAKNMSECYIIDHGGTFVSTEDFTLNRDAAQGSGGDFLYRFGNPYNYDQGSQGGYRDEGDHQMYGAHNVQWVGGANYYGFDEIGELPGEGNLLIFDNACWNPNNQKSVALEWSPYIMDVDGNVSADYVNPPDTGAFTSGSLRGYCGQVTWKYEAPQTGFYSNYISSVQRQPNGNTLIDAGRHAHYFEVTSGGEVVWEYFNPNTGLVLNDSDGVGTFRCTKLPMGHPALTGRDLAPKGNLRKMIAASLSGDAPAPADELAKFLGML